MRGNADLLHRLHDVFADIIVKHALAGDHVSLLCVESGRVIFEILNECAVLWPLKNDLCLAFIKLLSVIHFCVSPLCGVCTWLIGKNTVKDCIDMAEMLVQIEQGS